MSTLVASDRAYRLAHAVEQMAIRHATAHSAYVNALTIARLDHSQPARAEAFKAERTAKRRWLALRRLVAALRDEPLHPTADTA